MRCRAKARKEGKGSDGKDGELMKEGKLRVAHKTEGILRGARGYSRELRATQSVI